MYMRLALFVAVVLTAAVGCEPASLGDGAPQTTRTSAPSDPIPTLRTEALESPAAAEPKAGTMGDPAISATLERVTDGDTIVVRLDGVRERVRLIGIDTPEAAGSPRGPQPFAEEATEALVRLLHGGPVSLRFDAEERDRYGRLLAYVYAQDGTFVNEALIREGWARAIRVPPNVRHAKRFESLARTARRTRRGMWSAG